MVNIEDMSKESLQNYYKRRFGEELNEEEPLLYEIDEDYTKLNGQVIMYRSPNPELHKWLGWIRIDSIPKGFKAVMEGDGTEFLDIKLVKK